MASTTEREQMKANVVSSASVNEQPAGVTTGGNWTQRLNLSRLLSRPVTGAPTDQAGSTKRPGYISSTMRFFLGMIIFLFGAQLLGSLLEAANAANKWNLQRPFTNAGVLTSWHLSPLTLLYFAIAVALWAVLYYTRIIPHDPFGAKQQARQRAEQRKAATATAVYGSRRTRAERRQNAVTTAKPVASNTASTAVTSGAHDAAYDRVRAAQRTRRRRSTRR